MAGLFLLPATVLLIVFYMVPLMVLLSTSLHPFVPGSLEASPEFTLENYGRVFSSVYLSTLVLTIRISLITAVFAVIMAYPLANYLVRSRSGRIRTFVMAFLIGSFFIQLLIRVYAFLHVFGGGGVVNQLLLFFGFDAIEWIGGEWPVTVSMVHQTIPLAVLVLMGSIKSINPEIEDAARVLGATGIQTFLRVTLPLSLPGIISSSVLAFAGATSAFAWNELRTSFR